MKKHFPAVIQSSRSLPLLLLLRDAILTALCWLLYLYFVRDAFGFFGDLITYSLGGFKNYESYKSFAIIPTLTSYAQVILISNGVYFLWALYNKLYYGGKKRRRNAPPVTPNEVAASFKLNTTDVKKCQKAQTVIVHHNSEGRITNIVKV